MPLKQSTATAVWSGDVRSGSGRFTVGSGAFPEQQVTLSGRTEGADRMTNPEELIAAAHAVCYSMAFSSALGKNNTPPQALEVTATCSLDRTDAGLKISRMDLRVSGDVPGLDASEFERIAREAERSCPVSNALRGNIEIDLQVQARQASGAAPG